MKKTLPLLLLLYFFVQCNTVSKQNTHYQTLIPAPKLQADVAFAYKQLQKLHPNLYLYSSKWTLDHQFDSLKNTITTPMTPLAFFKKISPVVAAVKQGHLFVQAPRIKYTKKQTKALLQKGIGPLSQFDFEYLDHKLYLLKNNSQDSTILVGSEVISINRTKPNELIDQYSNYYASDGFNTTFKTRGNGARFTTFFTIENGIQDSLTYVLKYRDSLKTSTIKRFKKETKTTQNKKTNTPKKQTNHAQKAKKVRQKKRIQGYDPATAQYMRNIRFLEKDSSIAVLKIRGFKNKAYRRFYKETFEKIKQYQTKNLILDLRDNGGGRLSEISDLYAYLSDTTFVFLEPSEVVSRSQFFNGSYYNGGSFVLKILKTILSPAYYSYLLCTIHKKDNGKSYFATETKKRQANTNAFRGKVYVLINGLSFSASSILSSNLKGSKRAFFVGQETGGAYNGTVAGVMPTFKLPYSKLKIRTGLMHVVPFYKTSVVGHGIYPDHEILPTLQDRIQHIDPELNWILKDIKKAH
ncbi:S41 family peptidase [Flavobacterium crassostreae]|uniref:Peptidase S41 n=1 Tax=Flavobacterium crassostreae TaxID=1763534 RepID=A0A1B9E9U3_9FLAO|nr:S41 family peptidase [Flavobacterium crassostreae]OCB78661.1 peptidase S41 [Flavobacterium crassostreae]